MSLAIQAAKPTIPIANAKAWARQKRAHRLADVDAYLDTLYPFATKYGLDPAVLAAQSSEETDGWTSAWWNALNPAGIGVTGEAGKGLRFQHPEDAAHAHVVHMLIYARPTILQHVPRAFIALDTNFASPWFAGYAGKAKTVDQLAGKWATDTAYGSLIELHYRGIRDAIVTPQPTPQPTPGGAPLPANIVQIPTGNRNPRTHGQQPVAIIYHIADDMSFGNVRSWFQNPASNASSQVVIDRDGTIYQFVSSTETAWTNNDVKSPRKDIAWLNEAVRQNWINGGDYSINDFTLSIEHIGTPSDSPTEEQYLSSIALSNYWRDRYHIKPNRAHLMRHGDINSVDRSYCPGPHFDLARIIKALGGDPADMSA